MQALGSKAIGLIGASTLLLAACGVKPSDGEGLPAKEAVAVKLGAVTQGDVRSMLTYNGDLNPKYTINVLPKATGRIVKINVDLGSAVKKGDVIAQLEHTELDAQLAQANANLQAAQAKLATVNAQGRPEQVAQAQAQLDAANQKLASLKNQGRPEAVGQAQANLDAADQKLAALQQGRPEAVGQAQAQLDAAKAKLQQLLNGATPSQVQQAQLTVEQAKDHLFADQTNFDAQVGRGLMTKEMRQSALDADQTAIDQANAALKVLTDPPTADAVNQAKAAVDQAQHALDMAQHPGSQQDLAQAQAAVDAAQQQVALAQKPYTAEDVSQAEAAVRGAQAAVALAAKPFTSEDAQTAAAGVAQAQAAVDLVQTQIDDATVTAPADGVIAKKLQNAGDMAAPATPVVVLASTQWEVAVQVAEDAIAQVKQGTTVRMTAAAFPEQPFSGTITAISPVIDPQTRTFTVKVEPTGSTPDVRGGMSTRIDVPAAVHNGVPLVPKTAVVSKDGKSLVFTVDAGQAHAVPVTLGLSDDKSAEIVAGLQLGETIVIAGQDRLQDQDPVQVQES